MNAVIWHGKNDDTVHVSKQIYASLLSKRRTFPFSCKKCNTLSCWILSAFHNNASKSSTFIQSSKSTVHVNYTHLKQTHVFSSNNLSCKFDYILTSLRHFKTLIKRWMKWTHLPPGAPTSLGFKLTCQKKEPRLTFLPQYTATCRKQERSQTTWLNSSKVQQVKWHRSNANRRQNFHQTVLHCIMFHALNESSTS